MAMFVQGRPVAELCNEYQISQSLYYQWRDQCLANAARAFDIQQTNRKETRLVRANARLKTLVGELTLELKKATSGWADAAEIAPGSAA